MHFINADGKLHFTLDTGAEWSGFDGLIELDAAQKPALHTGSLFVTDADLHRTVMRLIGKQYKASGFSDTPGIVTVATLEIDDSSLCRRMLIKNAPTVTTQTHGTFRIVCVPSMKAGTPPIPDPMPTKTGTWKIQWTMEPRTNISQSRASSLAAS